MKLPKNIATALLAGASLAAAGGASAKPNDQLTVVDSAPESIKTAIASWKEGKRLSGRKDKCYGIALAGENEFAVYNAYSHRMVVSEGVKP